ncbi:type II toxin-antitoxin system RelE/ParE family toxin [bacterium]|nr:type II toxin-antitoxin system RelE/ParE family toxin [bacterium]QQR56430.1 MAG: type II toxin-antitoxin system RelE/ParE family toxin [Candidatus Melainabacteria bacterium]
MIKSFKCSKTRSLWLRRKVSQFMSFEVAAKQKLLMLNSVESLEELNSPPGNRLEALKGDRKGQYSIRINKQWRICFKWLGGDASEVEIVDYHS